VTDALLWAFVLANVFVLLVGSALVYLSYAAYRRTDANSFAYAGLGFGTVTAGSLVELVYDLLVHPGVDLGSGELVSLRTVESALIGLGLIVLFYSLTAARRP